MNVTATAASHRTFLSNAGVTVSSTAAAQDKSVVKKEQMISLLPSIKPEIFLSDRSLVAVYCFIKNFIGASGTSAVAIDNKIEQAMDLVKSHLMFAVREEVEVLKEKIAELMDRINQLEVENTILKANATQEVLSQLTTNSQNSSVAQPAPQLQQQLPQQQQQTSQVAQQLASQISNAP